MCFDQPFEIRLRIPTELGSIKDTGFMIYIWSNFALIFYLLATGGLIVYLVKQQKPIFRFSYWILVIGFICHTIFLGCQYYRLGAAPVLDFKSALSFFSWTIVCAYLIFQIKYKLMVLGSFVAPLACVLMILSTAIPQIETMVRPEFKSPLLTIHIGTAFMGNGLFALAFLGAIMYLILEYAIKHKKFGSLFQRLPSLATIDSINYRALIYGFTFLTIGMLTGSVYAQNTQGIYWQWDPKEVWSLITWFFYAALLHERIAIGWRGRKAAWMSIICFCLLIFTFLGSVVWLGGYHSFESLGEQKPL